MLEIQHFQGFFLWWPVVDSNYRPSGCHPHDERLYPLKTLHSSKRVAHRVAIIITKTPGLALPGENKEGNSALHAVG